jgi:hypothetical protein
MPWTASAGMSQDCSTRWLANPAALGAGQRHSIRRIADNLAELHVGDKAMMHGTLDVIGGSLVVHLTGTGEAS